MNNKYLQVYVAACLGLEGGVGNIVNRSLVAGVVDQTELGAVYGLLAIMDAILPFICKTRINVIRIADVLFVLCDPLGLKYNI